MRHSYIYNTLTEYKYWSGFRLMWEVMRYNNRYDLTTLIINRGWNTHK